jgi:hypothetical protein
MTKPEMKFLRRYDKGIFAITEYQAPNGDLVELCTYIPAPKQPA